MPRRLAAGAGDRRAAPPPCVSLQCSSSTRRPGPSSCRWWQSWRPDPKTSRPCRTWVSPHSEPASPLTPGTASPGAFASPCTSGRPGSSALPRPSRVPLPPHRPASRSAPPRSPYPASLPQSALLCLLSFWGGEGWGLEDGVPKFFQSSVRAVEAFSLFSGTLGVRPRGLNFHMGPYFHLYGNQKSVG